MALQFDHRPGETKLFEPNSLKSRGTWQEMLDELAKCDVVCANCHHIRTHERGEFSRRGRDWSDPNSPASRWLRDYCEQQASTLFDIA